ncbi:tRNA (adenosine(37)-N6)-threonylcarbamoyltransferase complex dimerization subunit type 1 TsaB [Candidatus Tisiphia endosymbiont of Oplodontha viridula]|uniref:tRNA (adenosine(37)-N6)-threonylcarbamoyltransferase complex dimerization subunit type 1 TsaB n=1 Tax=Candidatus Tisiphia endosymbiont of Oplodontha viridula TaxID=3077925 RepID=UPI0035C8BC8D
MKILAFDTVNNSASVAISEDKIILAYIEDLRPSMQAEKIVPMIEEALRIAKLSYHDLNYLAVTNGPGSFTGIRIGLSVAKGILLSTNIIGSTISNFELSWWRATRQVKNYNKNVVLKFFIFFNAYREQLYSQVFDQDGQVSIPLLINYDQAVQLLNIEDNTIKVCAGNGVGMIYDKIRDKKNVIILPRFTRVKALYICQYIADKIAIQYKFSNSIEPLYIRLADVKVK